MFATVLTCLVSFPDSFSQLVDQCNYLFRLYPSPRRPKDPTGSWPRFPCPLIAFMALFTVTGLPKKLHILRSGRAWHGERVVLANSLQLHGSLRRYVSSSSARSLFLSSLLLFSRSVSREWLNQVSVFDHKLRPRLRPVGFAPPCWKLGTTQTQYSSLWIRIILISAPEPVQQRRSTDSNP